MNFRKITIDDLEKLAEIHRRSFTPDHLTSHFPHTLLITYLNHLIDANEFNFALDDDFGKLNGFIIAGTKSGEAVKNFTRKKMHSILFILLKHPYFVFEKLKEIMLLIFGKKFHSVEYLRVYLIEVDELYHGSGVGKILINQFEQFLSKRNIYSYGLSVRKSNIRAISFYEKNSFICEYSDDRSIYFVKKIFNNNYISSI